jgi:hypothetical protein
MSDLPSYGDLPKLKTVWCRYAKRRVHTLEVADWLGQSADHAYKYYIGEIKREDIPPELLAEEDDV